MGTSTQIGPATTWITSQRQDTRSCYSVHPQVGEVRRSQVSHPSISPNCVAVGDSIKVHCTKSIYTGRQLNLQSALRSSDGCKRVETGHHHPQRQTVVHQDDEESCWPMVVQSLLLLSAIPSAAKPSAVKWSSNLVRLLWWWWIPLPKAFPTASQEHSDDTRHSCEFALWAHITGRSRASRLTSYSESKA